MTTPLFPTETTGPAGEWTGADLNSAFNYLRAWLDMAIVANDVTLPGDGAFRLTYTGATNLNNILGTAEGDKIILIAHRSAAGGNLTIKHGIGNIRTPGAIDVVMDDDLVVVNACNIGGLIKIHSLG